MLIIMEALQAEWQLYSLPMGAEGVLDEEWFGANDYHRALRLLTPSTASACGTKRWREWLQHPEGMFTGAQLIPGVAMRDRQPM